MAFVTIALRFIAHDYDSAKHKIKSPPSFNAFISLRYISFNDSFLGGKLVRKTIFLQNNAELINLTAHSAFAGNMFTQ